MLSAVNESRQVSLGNRVRVASSFWDRFVGLLGKTVLREEEGLWLSPCRSIHTFFMRIPIDVLFLDRQGIVLYQRTLIPWRLTPWKHSCEGVLELPQGTLRRTGTQPGDRVKLTPVT